MFDQLVQSARSARGAGARVRAFARVENAACSLRLAGMADMLEAAYAADGSADRDEWRFDNWSAVCAQIGAAHEVTGGVASGLLTVAVGLRDRLPRVGAVFAEGLISYRVVREICQRTNLVKDPATMRTLDRELAAMIRGWGAMSVDATVKAIDALVLRHDPYAVRRVADRARGHGVGVFVDDASGTATVHAEVSVTSGVAFDQRLDVLAATVCEHDPRTRDQLREAALGAVGFGWDRVPCLCERPDCDAARMPAGGGVVVYVVTREDTLADSGVTHPAPDPEPNPEPVDDDVPETDVPDVVDDVEPESGPTSDREPRIGDAVAQRRSLAGEQPRLLPKPWFTYTWAGLAAALHADPGERCATRPAAILGGPIVPGPAAARAAMHATITPLIHPGNAPPEPRYRPSEALAAFVRCRDQTCRWPGCTTPATQTDLDHTIAWPHGPTSASNLKCLCRFHHLMKTFWPGWTDRQHPDGTVEWTGPDGHTYTTHPGSRHLFPELCTPTAPVATRGAAPPKHTAGLTMPRRRTTRAQARRHAVDAQRRANTEAAEQHLRDCIPPF